MVEASTTTSGAGAMDRQGSYRRVARILAVCVGVFMVSLDLFIVNIAFPAIQETFPDASLSELSWILNAYAIVFGALLVPAGRWADRSGRKHAFQLGLGIFTVASAACAVAPSVPALVIARVVQAIGAAMLFPTSLGLLLPEWSIEKRRVAVGIWSAVSGVAAAAGPPLGGLLVEAGWRWIFIVNVPIGIVTFLAVQRLLRNTRDEHATGRPDIVGAAVFSVAIATLILAILQGQSWGWTSQRVVALFAVAVVLMLVVAFRCARHPLPLVDPVIGRTRAIALANVGAILFFMAMAALLLGAVLFQISVWHVSVLTAGLQCAPGPLTSAVFAVPGAVLGQRFGERYTGAAGALLFALGALWFHSTMAVDASYASSLLPSQLIQGAGVGLVLPTLSAAATSPLPPSRLATGTALLGMTRQVGSALGVAGFVAILAQPTQLTLLQDFKNVWTFMIVCSIGAGAVLLALGTVRVGAVATASETRAADTAVAETAGAPAIVAYQGRRT